MLYEDSRLSSVNTLLVQDIIFSKDEGSLNVGSFDLFVKPSILKIANSLQDALSWTNEDNKKKFFGFLYSNTKSNPLHTFKNMLEKSKSEQNLNFKKGLNLYILEETEGEAIKPASYLKLLFNAQLNP